MQGFRFVVVMGLCLCGAIFSTGGIAQDGEKDTQVMSAVAPPEISFVPRTLTLTMDSSTFLTSEVSVLNRGGSPLELKGVKASCGCAGATILKNPVNPLEVGKIRFQINTVNVTDTLMRIEFAVENNATASPVVYKVFVRNPMAKK